MSEWLKQAVEGLMISLGMVLVLVVVSLLIHHL